MNFEILLKKRLNYLPVCSPPDLARLPA